MSVNKYDLEELLEQLDSAYSDASNAENTDDIDDANRYAGFARSTIFDLKEKIKEMIYDIED